MMSHRRHLAIVLVTFCCGLSGGWVKAISPSPRTSGPSISEQVQAIAAHSTAIRDAHGSALRVLESSTDFPMSLRALRRDLAKLTERLPQDTQLSSLGEQSRQLAAQLAQQLPTGKLEPETASRMDRDALTTARRAEALRHEISSIREEIRDTLDQAQKWENAYYAFDFDPRRQRQIVRALIADRRQSLTEQPSQKRIEPDPELPTAITTLASADPAPFPLDLPPFEPIVPLDPPPADAEPVIELRRAILPNDPLRTALERTQANPTNPKARRSLNNECFKKLTQIGPQILQPASQTQLPVATMEHLEAAARLKVPAALHLLGLMHLTGQGSGLNYPRGTAYLKEAAKLLEANPQEPFGPGVDADSASRAISRVGTSWFWLAESYLLGLMEQQPETAATLYRTAAHYGDPRAHQRIRQLTAVDRSRVYISWPPTDADTDHAPTFLGLLEHCGTDLDDLETRLATKTALAESKPQRKPQPVAAPEEEVLRPFLGIDFARNDSAPGVGIRSVLFGSPADLAGLRTSDLIIQVNDRSTSTLDDFNNCLHKAKPGDIIKLRVLRPEQQPFEVTVKLGTVTALNDSIEAILEPVSLPSSWNPHQVGFRIMSVRPNSPAARAGLRPGDIALGANDRHFRQWNDLATALYNRNGITTLLIQRRLPGNPPQLLSVVISAK